MARYGFLFPFINFCRKKENLLRKACEMIWEKFGVFLKYLFNSHHFISFQFSYLFHKKFTCFDETAKISCVYQLWIQYIFLRKIIIFFASLKHKTWGRENCRFWKFIHEFLRFTQQNQREWGIRKGKEFDVLIAFKNVALRYKWVNKSSVDIFVSWNINELSRSFTRISSEIHIEGSENDFSFMKNS